MKPAETEEDQSCTCSRKASELGISGLNADFLALLEPDMKTFTFIVFWIICLVLQVAPCQLALTFRNNKFFKTEKTEIYRSFPVSVSFQWLVAVYQLQVNQRLCT